MNILVQRLFQKTIVIPAKAGIQSCASARHLSLRRSRAWLLVPVLLLMSCGFRPIYGGRGNDGNSPVALDLNNVAIENIPNREGQMLRNDLIDRMYGKNRPIQASYKLKVSVRSTEEDLGILANATATRALLNLYGDYTLTDNADNVLIKGTAHSVASFDRLDQMYGTVVARQNAFTRTIHELSEQIVNRLSLYFSERH